MRKVISLLDCSNGEPMDPLSGDTPEEIFEYSAERGAWFASCIAELGTKLPPHPNVDDPDKFEDNKVYVWTRTIASRGIDFKLDFFDPPESKPFISHSDGL